MKLVLDISGKPIPPLWVAEFRGFFFGEGYLGITTNGTNRANTGPSYVCRAQIAMRDDESPILYAIQKKLGGIVYGCDARNKNQNPFCVWRVTSSHGVARVCDILADGILPARKRRQVAVVRAFIRTLNEKCGPRFPNPALSVHNLRRRADLHAQIKRLHAYRPIAA